MHSEFSVSIAEIMNKNELFAIQGLKEIIGFDALVQPDFWECVVAACLGGEKTGRTSEHDIDVEIWGRHCRAEVKFSKAFMCGFKGIRGKDWSRKVFKWALPRGNNGKACVDACILIGVDDDDLLYCWIVPRDAIKPDCASITVTAPSCRAGGLNSPWDCWLVPWNAMLPAFASICHNAYDAPMRRSGIRQRARAANADADLFPA